MFLLIVYNKICQASSDFPWLNNSLAKICFSVVFFSSLSVNSFFAGIFSTEAKIANSFPLRISEFLIFSGNLVICEILKIHIDENVLDSEKNIDPLKLNALSRLGGNWYGKATKDSLFELKKPIGIIGMGFDNLPKEIRNSSILSGSDLAILASAENIPAKKEFRLREGKNTTEKHILAKELLSQEKSEDAWQILL